MSPSTVYLFDTNAIIEAVRTSTWAAICGGVPAETVNEVAEECLRGDSFRTGYVKVKQADLDRMRVIHTPSPTEVAGVQLHAAYRGLDAGEEELMAHVINRAPSPPWVVCSPDRAAMQFAVRAGFGDNLVSLETVVAKVGGRPVVALADHFSSKWLSEYRTLILLDRA